ncbi:MAG: 30S ribosomal protein S16 [Terriglobia bacterium]
MAVKIRLSRRGTKKKPHYRLVVVDSRMPRDGRFIDMIGRYNPRTEPSEIEIDKEKALHWLQVGAQPSAAVLKLLKIKNIQKEFEAARAKGAKKAS